MNSGDDIQALDVLRRIWKLKDDYFIAGLSTPERSVLAALLVHADKRWEAWPSLTTIQKGTGLHRSTVVRVLDKLEAKNLIVRDRRPPRRTQYRLSGAMTAPASRFMQLVAQSDHGAAPDLVASGDRTSRTERPELNTELPTKVVVGENPNAHAGAHTREEPADTTTDDTTEAF